MGGIIATADAHGNPLVVINLWTGVGADRQTTLLVVDPDEETTNLYEYPEVNRIGPGGDRAFACFISRAGKFYYTLGNNRGEHQLYEFDLADREWHVVEAPLIEGETVTAFTEDEQGRIYIAVRPTTNIYVYDPQSGQLEDLGPLLELDWRVYPHIRTDDQGWIYLATRFEERHIVAFHPDSGEIRRDLLKPEDQGESRSTNMYRSTNGKVYMNFDDGPWYELYGGEAHHVPSPRGSIALVRNGWGSPMEFPDGRQLTAVRVADRYMEIEEEDGESRRVQFDYPSEGVSIYSLAAGSDGRLYGSTGIPLRYFVYDP